jgi:hypothetical protein
MRVFGRADSGMKDAPEFYLLIFPFGRIELPSRVSETPYATEDLRCFYESFFIVLIFILLAFVLFPTRSLQVP